MAHEMIALVQQDPNVAHELAHLLHDSGYTTSVFTTLDGTYDQLAADPPDALIVGLHFPDERHGLDLVTLLKLQGATRSMPIVLTSQDTPFLEASHAQLQAQSVPAIWTHARPFDQAALLHTLEHALQQR